MWDELNDFGAHENPSHNAIAIRPAKASEIRYAVMPASFVSQIVTVARGTKSPREARPEAFANLGA